MQAKLVRYLSRIHKTLGLIVGLQFLFWSVSGFYFSIFPIETIHGDHLRRSIDHGTLDTNEVRVSVDQVSVIYSGSVRSATLDMFLGKPIWRIKGNGAPNMIDAISGQPIIIDQALVRSIVSQGTTVENHEMLKIQLIESKPPREYGGPLPVYQAIDTISGARFYIPVETGDIKSVRTNAWRLFDVLWRFHIQDVTGKDRFDSWWLRIFAGSAILFTLTGTGLLLHRWKVGRLFS